MSDFSFDDHRFMARAIQLAGRGMYTTMPNPRVGSLIVYNGKIIAEGWHEWAGKEHAEIHALNKVGKQAKNTTVYISLEPCSHYGRTPPCIDMLIKSGVSKVIVAMQDPNPLVSGRGLSKLKSAGVDVLTGLLESEAVALNKGYIKRMKTKKPLVRAKLAMSIDGRTAMASGESQWITGLSARTDSQRLRASSCAIITGIGTILNDNAALTVRKNELDLPNAELVCKRQPLRVVVDSQLRIPVSAKVVTGSGKCLVVTTEQADITKKKRLEDAGAEVLVMDIKKGQVCLKSLLKDLAERECNEVLLEAGATLAGSMLQKKLLDEIIIYMAPVLLGSDAKPLFNLPFKSMSEKQTMTIADIRPIGADWRITAKPEVLHKK